MYKIVQENQYYTHDLTSAKSRLLIGENELQCDVAADVLRKSTAYRTLPG